MSNTTTRFRVEQLYTNPVTRKNEWIEIHRTVCKKDARTQLELAISQQKGIYRILKYETIYQVVENDNEKYVVHDQMLSTKKKQKNKNA